MCEKENNICIIDDAIMTPASELGIQNSSIFYMNDFEKLFEKEWDDTNVKNICAKLSENGWQLLGFSNPEFYIKKLTTNFDLSGIVIFDWEYKTEVKQYDVLMEILQNYPVYIIVYSSSTHEKEIKELLNNSEMQEFQRRLFYISKDDENVQQNLTDLLEQIRKIVEEDFSYNIGEQLKRIFYISLTKVLASFSNINTEDMLELLSEGPNSQNEIDHSIKDFISEKIKSFIECSDDIHQSIHEKTQNDNIDKTLLELLCSKIKNTIINTKLEITNTEELKTDKKLSESVMQKLWSYRLYDNPTDKIVRMGDIIRKKDDVNYEKLYLILTDNCKLHRFNKKTNGLLNVVELEKIDNNCKINIKNITSLTNKIDLTGINGNPLILPYIKVKNNELEDYLLQMQKHVCINDLKIEEHHEYEPLSYEYIENYERICCLSSSFLLPLIGTIITNLFGWGCPDYPQCIQDNIKNRCKGTEIVAPEVVTDA